jgi:hypothetical protein
VCPSRVTAGQYISARQGAFVNLKVSGDGARQEEEHDLEFKLFGSGGFPNSRFLKGLKVFFALNDQEWDVIAKWLLETDSFDPRDFASSPLIVNSSLTPDKFMEGVEVLQFLFEAWSIYGLDIREIQRDLMLLGFPGEQIERLGGLLQRVGPVRERAYNHYMRSESENAVLPTLEDIDVVCDLRPIFEDFVYPAPMTQNVKHTKILGFTHMVLVELVTEDTSGRTHRLAFQMTEEGLYDFEATLRRAHEQLDILKASTRALSERQ